MKIESVKDLQKVIALCRKAGVDSIKVGEIEFHLGAMPTKTPKNTRKYFHLPDPETPIITTSYVPGGVTEDIRIVTDELTEEELLFYSSDSTPEQAGT